LPHAVEAFHVFGKDRKQDIAPLAEAMARKSAADLKIEMFRKICDRERLGDMDMETVAAAIQLCYDAVLDTARYRDVCDGRRSLETRRKRAFVYANAYINKWAQDRGLDFGRIRQLRRKAGVA